MRGVQTVIMLLFVLSFCRAENFERDTIATRNGDLVITFIGHGTLMFTWGDMVIHVDPVGRFSDYAGMPKADLILVTHHHGDHFDRAAIELLTQAGTDIILTQTCYDQGVSGIVMNNGDEQVMHQLRILAVPAYNVVHMRDNGQPFHPKGAGNGYVLYFSDFSVYIAGDTENIPEMKEIAGVDCAFLPMNLPYTMTPQMVADAASILRPKILYPYHFGDTDTGELLRLMEDHPSTEIRIRKMN